MKYKKTFLILLILFLSFLFVMFIITYLTRPEYPESWSDISTENECPNLAGSYINTGGCQRDYVPSLYQVLIANDMGVAGAIDYIKITQTKTELLIKAYKQGALIKQRKVQFSPKDCENGFMRIEAPEPEGGVNREGVVGYQLDVYWLAKAADGTLVVRYNSYAAAVVNLIPIIATQRDWYRFSQQGEGVISPR
jgi:hypothetical protein